MDYPVALLDANVLFSGSLRDLLMRLAVNELFIPKWTDLIHEEWINAVLKRRPDLKRERLNQTREQMNLFVLDAIVDEFEALIPTLDLPDPNDRHVLAAAIKGKADLIITHNLKDFPPKALESYKIKALHPDTFIYQLFNSSKEKVLATMKRHRSTLKYPPKSAEEYLLTLEKQGLIQTVGAIQDFKSLI